MIKKIHTREEELSESGGALEIGRTREGHIWCGMAHDGPSCSEDDTFDKIAKSAKRTMYHWSVYTENL